MIHLVLIHEGDPKIIIETEEIEVLCYFFYAEMEG